MTTAMFAPQWKAAGISTTILQQDTQPTKDDRLGNRFGARVKSESKQKIKEGYHEHFFTDVVKNGVADKMGIRSGDQLVLINQKFAPRVDHNNVLDIFSRVPVDSKTRFELVVLRRCTDERWEWISTSAILVPEPYHWQFTSDEPSVRDLHYKNCYGSTFKDTHIYRMKVAGTQLYLAIVDGQVRFEVSESDDEEKYNICLKTKCELDEGTGETSYDACLYKQDPADPRRKGYMHVSDDGGVAVTVQETPQWFLYKESGNGQAFKVLTVNKWLGCDIWNFGTAGRFSLKSDPYFFEAHALEHGQRKTQKLDAPDGSLEDSLSHATESTAQNHSDSSPSQIYVQPSVTTSNTVPFSSYPMSLSDAACNCFNQAAMISEPNQNSCEVPLPKTATEEAQDLSHELLSSLRQAILQANCDSAPLLPACTRDKKMHKRGTDTPDSGYGSHSRNSPDPKMYTVTKKQRH